MTDYCCRLLAQAADDARPFTVSENGVRTRRDFAVAAAGWKAAFEKSGVRSAALYFTDIFDSAAALFGCWAAGVRAVLPADTSEALLHRLVHEAQACAGDFPVNCPLPLIDPLEAHEPCRTELDASKPLAALFTSGSTGEPTLVPKRLSQLFCEVESICARGHGREKPLDENAVIFSSVSQQHIYGLLFALLWPLRSAHAVWHERILYVEELLGHAAKAPAAVWIASPAHLNRLPEHPLWDAVRPLWRTIYSSGGPLSDEGLKLCLARTGLAPVELLGSSESGGIAWRTRTVDAQGKIGSTGYRALSGTQWRIEDGRLVIKSAQLASDGWEVTADRAAPGPDGETFELLGRADRIVKIEGKRVSLKTIESALLATGLVTEVKAFTRRMTGENESERIAVAAVTTPEAGRLMLSESKAGLVKRFKAELLKHIERVCLPRQWRFTWALPRNAMGKATTQAADALFAPGALQAALLDAPDENAVRLVVSVAADSPFFEGHFPEFALLPGVVQIQWALEAASRYWRTPLTLQAAKALKFMSPIRPGDTVVLTLAREAGKIRFAYEKPDGAALSKALLLVSESVS